MRSDRKRVFTIGAWSPALRTQLASRIEPCGCVVGVYQSWRGQPMAVIDMPNPKCTEGHRMGDVEDSSSQVSAAPTQRH